MPTKSEFAPAPLAKEPYSARLLDNIWQNHVKHPNKPAFISADDDSIRVTHLQLYLSSQSVAAFLNNIHFGHGDVSSIVLPNCWEYFAIFVGVAVQGGAISGASTVFTEMELARQFQDSKTKVVFCADTVLDKVIKASRGLGIISIVVVPSDPRSTKKELPFGVHDIQDVFAAQPQTNQPKIKHDIDTDLLILPYSSGTTGPPKGVMLSHANVGTVLNIWIQHFEKNIKPRLDPNWNWETENTLLVLPFYHMYGFTLAHQCILTGSTGIIMKRFELDKYLRAIEKYKIRVLNVAPPILVFLAKSPLVEKYNLSCLEFIVTRSAPARQEIIEEVLKRLPKIKFITQAYGMTEIGLIGAHYPVDKPEQYNAVGKLASNLELKIVDPSTRKELNTGEIGEICVRGPSVMNGYLGNPTATAGTFEDGWLKTGDVGYVDKDGWLYIVERLKELIKVKGFQVAPAELEDLLLSHPDIQDSAVIGVPDPVAGELPKAFVVRKRDTLTEEDVKNFVKAKAAPYKQLQGGVEFMKEIPKSASGKILRRILRDQVAKADKKPVLSKL